MTKQEIINRVEQGESLKVMFGIRNLSFYIFDKRITEKQYDSAKKHFGDKLDFRATHGGLTVHYYTLKQILQ